MSRDGTKRYGNEFSYNEKEKKKKEIRNVRRGNEK